MWQGQGLLLSTGEANMTKNSVSSTVSLEGKGRVLEQSEVGDMIVCIYALSLGVMER